MSCYRSNFPKTKQIVGESLQKYKEVQNTLDVFTAKTIPSQSALLSWRAQLTNIASIASDRFYVETSMGRLGLSEINSFISLFRAKETKLKVDQEIDFFNSPYLKPQSVAGNYPNIASINAFRSMIHNNVHNLDVTGVGFPPEELARLCCKRYLGGDHIQWVLKELSTHKGTLCVFLNEVQNIERFVRKNSSDETNSIFFVINIGRKGHDTFVSTYGNPGCHWAICSYEHENVACFYGDSLGWKVPNGLDNLLTPFIKACFGTSNDLQIVQCHETTPDDTQHKCSKGCSLRYPLQTCFNVCGSLLCFGRSFYHTLIS